METLKGSEPRTTNEEEMVSRFVKLMEIKNWVYNLPVGALEDHPFMEIQTQATVNFGQLSSQNLGSNKTSKSNQLQSEFNLNGTGEIKIPTKENQCSVISGNCMKRPNKRIVGKRPFNMPQEGILADVISEVLV